MFFMGNFHIVLIVYTLIRESFKYQIFQNFKGTLVSAHRQQGQNILTEQMNQLVFRLYIIGTLGAPHCRYRVLL